MKEIVANEIGKQLVIQHCNGINVVDSREVAEMINVRHADLLKNIRNYCDVLAEGNFSLGDFFIESTYLDANKQERPCYLLTKQGCEMVANKLTGEKGVLFTAQYVQAFNEMEQHIVNEIKDTRTLIDKALDFIMLLPKNKYTNQAVIKIMDCINCKQIEDKKVSIKDILEKFLAEENGILKVTKNGLALNKEKLYSYFEKYGYTKHETLSGLKESGIIPEIYLDNVTPNIKYRGKVLRAVVVSDNED
ncbi:MAG: Rha family transcriptional regulator [Bacilli bacterium]